MRQFVLITSAGVPAAARTRFQPWACTFHCNDGAPCHFVAFGGKAGMESAVSQFLGARF